MPWTKTYADDDAREREAEDRDAAKSPRADTG